MHGAAASRMDGVLVLEHRAIKPLWKLSPSYLNIDIRVYEYTVHTYTYLLHNNMREDDGVAAMSPHGREQTSCKYTRIRLLHVFLLQRMCTVGGAPSVVVSFHATPISLLWWSHLSTHWAISAPWPRPSIWIVHTLVAIWWIKPWT